MKSKSVSTSIGLCSGLVALLVSSLTPQAFAQTDAAASAPAAPTPSAQEAAPSTPTAPVTNPGVGGCSLEQIAALHREASRFLVEVHARQGSTTTTGVLIGSNRVLVPYAEVIGQGWPITVYFGDGKESSAKIVSDLRVGNFAVISIDSPPPGLTPRSFVKTKPHVGMPLISVGKPLHGEKNIAWEMRSSYVSTALEDHLRASIATEPGAPLLDCSGQVVGVQEKKVYSVSPDPGAMTGEALAKAVANAPKKEVRGYIAYGILDPTVVVALRPGETGIGGRFTFFDSGFSPWFFIKANIGAQWLTVPERSDYVNATDITRWRMQFEAVTGLKQRFMLGSPGAGFLSIDMQGYLGFAARTDHTSFRRLKANSTTAPESRSEEHPDPLIGVRFELLSVAASYQFQLDLKTPRQSIHTLGLSVNF